MKIRMKISYFALLSNVTVKELMIYQITKTFQEFYRKGCFPLTLQDLYLQQNSLYEAMLPLRSTDSIVYMMNVYKIFSKMPVKYYYYEDIKDKSILFDFK